MRLIISALASSLLLVGCTPAGSSEPHAMKAAPKEFTWPTEGLPTGGGAPAPEFPASDPTGWHMANSWDVQGRLVGDDFVGVEGDNQQPYPVTMNGCGERRFLLRWRVLGDQNVIAGWAGPDVPDLPKEVDPLPSATGGWMSLDGCSQPQFKADAGPNILVTVVATVVELSPRA